MVLAHPVELDVGVLRGRKPEGVDLDVAEGRRLVCLDLGAHLADDLMQRGCLARAGHACHIQALPQAVLTCEQGTYFDATLLVFFHALEHAGHLSALLQAVHNSTRAGNHC